ncbi:MAG: hypothetical protein H8E44_41475 [Planctomycetes bacterium]|nr:hypothetical protein [Planctomycetota bacterium]
MERTRLTRAPRFAMRLFLMAAFILLLLSGSSWSHADQAEDTQEQNDAMSPAARLNLRGPTFGGKQLWSDETVFREWRIQRNSITGHYRLLDETNKRRVWGTFEHCREKLERLKQDLDLPPLRGKVVIVLHGLFRSRASMAELCDYLSEQGEFTALNVSYASTRSDLNAHAAGLARVIEFLGPEVVEINFVAHSLGNLVIRRYLACCYKGSDGFRADPRIHRFVMLAPPNRGARLAEYFKGSKLVKWVWGDSVTELAAPSDELQKRLAVPRCQFAIIAGGKSDPDGRNRLIPGDDDFVVTVEETKLAGARDFVVIPTLHSFIMNDTTTREYTSRFLEHGHFVSESLRRPIAPETDTGP